MIKIIYPTKSRLYPAFGEADTKRNIVYIRKDLPRVVKSFIREHELYHLKDKSKNWIWREIKSNFYGLIKHPLGFIVAVIMSLQPYRIKLYIQRIKEKI